MKNIKYIFVFCGTALVLIFGISLSKSILPNAISESTSAAGESESYSMSTVTDAGQTTENQTSKVHTTVLNTVKTESTVSQTEKTSENKTESPHKTETTVPKPQGFPIRIPSLNLPDLPSLTTAMPTTPSGQIDLSCFDNTVFIGNSRFISFKNYGLAKNVYSVVGLNVDTVFTKSVSGSDVTVINELNGKDFDKVILMFGDNECGWPNQDVFIERYARVIAAVKERNPNARIYLHAILPVSAEASAKSEFGCNNETINSLNERIKQLAADENVNYIEQPTCLKDSDGALLPEAASDGIHLNKKYSEIWLNHLAKTIF